MNISTKELRERPAKAISLAIDGQEVIITYRGKPAVRIIPFVNEELAHSADSETIFGLWRDRTDLNDVASHVRDLRKERQF
jgi:prevent-host-death family protein